MPEFAAQPSPADADPQAHRLDRVKGAISPAVEGLEHLPAEGAAIVAFNHLTPADALLGQLVAGRRITFAGGMDEQPRGVRGWLARRLHADHHDAEPDPARPGLRVLARGDLLGIFPEGLRSPDGRLYKGHTLVARLALTAGVPVVPAAVVSEPGQGMLGWRIVFGEPLDLSRFQGLPDAALGLRAATDTVMAAIAEISGQDYVDRHSAERRVELEQERRQDSEAARARQAADRAARVAAERQARAQAAQEAAELARIHAEAAEAAREQARRAAESDARRSARTGAGAARSDTGRPDPGRPDGALLDDAPLDDAVARRQAVRQTKLPTAGTQGEPRDLRAPRLPELHSGDDAAHEPRTQG